MKGNGPLNQIECFYFNDQKVRTIAIDGEPYFVGKDVAEILGYKNTKDALLKHVDDDDKLGSQIATSGQRRLMTVINESGLYSLILSSKLPSTKKFKHWVTSEVLPAIRKHGGYLTNEKIEEALLNPDTLIKLATQLKREREGRLIAEQRVNELTPKADYYDLILRSESLVTITQIAKDYGMSGGKMNLLLHDLGVIYKQNHTWLLYSKYQNLGWTQSVTFGYGDYKYSRMYTKWTTKGRIGLYQLLKKHGYLPLIEKEEQ